MNQWFSRLDRIGLNSILIVLCFVSVLVLSSQSAASYASYALTAAMLARFRDWDDVFRLRIIWLVSAILLYLTQSGLWSAPFEYGDWLSTTIRGLLVLAFVVAFAECQLRGDVNIWLRRAMAVIGTVAVAFAIANFLVSNPADGRLNGLGQLDTHVVAALTYGVILLFLLETFLIETSMTWRVLALAAAIVVALAVIWTDSRNAWVSVSIGACVLALAHSVEDRLRFVASLMAVGLVLVVFLVALLAGEATRESLLPRGLSFRPDIWGVTLERIFDGGFWFGLGINTSDDLIIDGVRFLHPHSMYLAVWYQGGLVALIAFILLIGWSIRELLSQYHEPAAKLALGIFGISLPAYLLDGHELVDKVGSTWFLLWMPTAIAIGLRWRRPAAG